MALIKYCRKCGENTERHPTSKRCIECKKKLDAVGWERRKQGLQSDPEKLEAYRAAAKERMSRYHQRKRDEFNALPYSEQFHILREREAARRAKSRWI